MRVFAANEDMVKYLKHPISKVGFTSMDMGVNWPNDSFTTRRIRDGDVTVEKKKKAEPEPAANMTPAAEEEAQ
jgi:hypothetical protein